MSPPTRDSPSSELLARIHHLHLLLQNLPPTLPLDPDESNYHFGLDEELINDEAWGWSDCLPRTWWPVRQSDQNDQDCCNGTSDGRGKVDTVPHCVDSTEKGPGGSLVGAGEHEDIWAFINFDACM